MANIKIIRGAKPSSIDQNILKKADKRLDRSSFGELGNIPPIWGKVVQVSGKNHVDVELTNGLRLVYVPVRSERWVKKVSSESTGHKDIPGVGSKVLLVFPDGIIENALILCSGFDSLDDSQKEVLLKDDERELEIDIDEFGWKITKDKETGEITIESPDDTYKVTISIDIAGKEININQDFTGSENDVMMDANGINISDKNGNTIEMSSTSILMNNNLEILR
ncbi:MAG: hypothetical protein WC516_06565 [Patescibacteria group bacterium]|jgi:hypothetical protein